MRISFPVIWMLIASLIYTGIGEASMEPRVEVNYLGSVPMLITVEGCIPLPVPRNLAVSLDYRHIAYWAERGNKAYVVVDGKEIGEYDQVDWLSFSPDGKHYYFVAFRKIDDTMRSKQTGSSKQKRPSHEVFLVLDGIEMYDTSLPKFSPDGKRLCLVVERAGKKHVLVDGVDLGEYDEVGYIQFSEDSKHLAFRAKRGDKEYVVLDGRAGPFYGQVCAVGFAPTINRPVYWARRASKWLLILHPQKVLQELPQGEPLSFFFSQEGKLVGYGYQKEKRTYLVIHGREYGPFNLAHLDFLRFTSDGKHFSCYLRDGDKERVMVDGEIGPPFDAILGFCFSPDGKRWGYCARRGKRFVLVMDGLESAEYDYIMGSPVFSPDSQRWACYAKRGEKYVMIVDGMEGEEYDHIGHYPVFSHDSKRIAYWAERDGKRFVVLDGAQVTPDYDKIRPLQLFFSPDSKHLAHWALAYEAQQILVGVDGKIIGSAPAMRELHYPGTPGRMQYVVFHGSDLWRIELHWR